MDISKRAEEFDNLISTAGASIDSLILLGNQIDTMYHLLMSLGEAVDEPLSSQLSPEMTAAIDAVLTWYKEQRMREDS